MKSLPVQTQNSVLPPNNPQCPHCTRCCDTSAALMVLLTKQLLSGNPALIAGVSCLRAVHDAADQHCFWVIADVVEQLGKDQGLNAVRVYQADAPHG